MLPEIIPPVSEPLLITSPLNFIISPSKVLSQKVDSFKKFNLSDLTITTVSYTHLDVYKRQPEIT